MNGGTLKIARYLDSPGEWITLLNTTDYEEEKDNSTWATDSQGGGEFVPDADWVKPSHSKRDVGKVDWSLLDIGLMPPGVEEL